MGRMIAVGYISVTFCLHDLLVHNTSDGISPCDSQVTVPPVGVSPISTTPLGIPSAVIFSPISTTAAPQAPETTVPLSASFVDGAQITAILQQIDGMWEAIARLRQAHLERTTVPIPSDEASDVRTSLPDYASVDHRRQDSCSTTRLRASFER